jgi:hypothetical protein
MRFSLFIVCFFFAALAFGQPGMYGYSIQLRLKTDSGFAAFLPSSVEQAIRSKKRENTRAVKKSGKLFFTTEEYDIRITKKTKDYYSNLSVSLSNNETVLYISYKMLHYSDIHKKGARDNSYFELEVYKKGTKGKNGMTINFGVNPADRVMNITFPFCPGIKKNIGLSKTPQDEIMVMSNAGTYKT